MESTLTSQITRSTTPASIESDLAALWREVGRQGSVARAVTSNLVVFRQAHSAVSHDDMADEWLDAVVARHPCRLIVLDYERENRARSAPFAVTIRIVTFGTEASRYGIEQIAVRTACADACLPSIVNGLVRGDVPTSLWWMDDFSQAVPLESVVRIGRQFVYDSRDWRDVRRGMGAARSLLASGARLDLADLNWRRLTAVRQGLLHACTPAGLEALGRGRVRVVHRPGESALAWLTVGWLTSRLQRTRDIVPAVAEGGDGDTVLTIHIDDGPATLSAVLDDHHVVVTSPQRGCPIASAVPRENRSQAVAAELLNLRHDICLHEAIRAAALWLD
jgi:glucose-6-phosphate dehydrogenase assembly protein OpcA